MIHKRTTNKATATTSGNWKRTLRLGDDGCEVIEYHADNLLIRCHESNNRKYYLYRFVDDVWQAQGIYYSLWEAKAAAGRR